MTVAGQLALNNFEVTDMRAEVNTAHIIDVGNYLVDSDNAIDLPNGVAQGVLSVIHFDYLNEKKQLLQDSGSYRSYERWETSSGFGDSLAWRETNESKAMTDGYREVLKKANIVDLPQTFSGITEPLNTLGKDYDRYHEYEAGSIHEVEYCNGTSKDPFSPYYFHLIERGDPIQNGVIELEVGSVDNIVLVQFLEGMDIPLGGLKLFITNPSAGEVEIDLTVTGTTSHSITATYSTLADPTIDAIVDTSTYRFVARHGVSADRDIHYVKMNGVWQEEVTTASIEKTIREYDTTVSMDTVHNIPSLAECTVAFEQLPHYNYTKDDHFYIMSTNKSRLNFVKYFANGETQADGTDGLGKFFEEELVLTT